VPWVPFVRLLAALDKAALGPPGRLVFACYWARSEGLDFCAPLLVGVRAEAVEALVAHELGHAYARARGLSHRDEDLGNRLLRWWGWDPGQLP
jgi:hypothetical protein